ncbi:probable peptidoglycan muropeptide transporter SLC46 [Lepeophtheirus salmonis]|uniref:Solute carrier family 46 member 3like [Bombyx mori] n=1 Tax=Lepeophtheirus salmonis TaxID=72036 RepID=A0A0K2V7A1_LEPSM|nr:uncharacterized protein LOC121128965 [Lepeophtheirus salmonis]
MNLIIFMETLKYICSNISLEPFFFLSGFANELVYITTQQMQIYKACRIDLNYTSQLCDNLLDDGNEDYNKKVQDTVAQFGVYLAAITQTPTIFLAFYYGVWVDAIGRKTILNVHALATVLSQALLIANGYFLVEWSNYIYILTVSVPIMLVGGKSTSFIATTAFITDISPPRMAAVRLGILHVTQSISEPLANIVGAFLLDSGGFVVVYLFGFIFSAAAYVSLYVCMMKYKTTITEKRKKSFRELMSPRIFIDCFKTFSKVRAGKLRMILYLSLVNLILILTSIIGEATIAYLYVRTRYKWEVTDFSFYKSIDKVTAIFFQSALIPLLSYVNINNENFLICIIISFCLRHLTMGLAYEPWLYYAGTMLDVIGSYAFSIIRATISDILPKSEMGKVLSMVISLENIMIIISIKIYQTIWSMTDTILPGTVYFVSAFMCSWALVSTLIIKFHLKGKSIGKYFEEVTGKDRDENDLVTSKPKKLKSEEVEANEDGYENNFTRQA